MLFQEQRVLETNNLHHELTSIRFATSDRHKVKGSCNWPIRKPLLRGSLDENHNAEVPDVEAQLLAEVVTSDISDALDSIRL